jgi:large subunit ribosomal protein L24
MKIQRNDSVIVIAGDETGAAPRRVIQVLGGGRKLLVEGVNRVYKHVKRGHPKSPQGGRLNLEMPIDSSNVMLYCGSCNKATRVGFRYRDDGSKERYCKSCDASIGAVSRPSARYARKSQ